MAKADKAGAVRNRLARAMTVSGQEFIPPSFGIAFAQKSTLPKQTDGISVTSQALKQSSVPKLQQPQPAAPPTPQVHGPAQLVSSEIPTLVSRFNIDIRSSPRTNRAQPMLKKTRPGSVFIPRRSPIDRSLTEWSSNKPAVVTTITSTITPTATSAPKNSTATSRVRLASPMTQNAEVNPHDVEPQPVQSQNSHLHLTESVSSHNGILCQNRAENPTSIVAEPQTIPPISAPTVLQQPQALQPLAAYQPNQPAFAVIAQDSSALQALLSGDFGGRTFIIQPLQQPYVMPQFQPTAAQLPAFAVSQPLMQSQVRPQQQELPLVTMPQRPPLNHQPLQCQSSQNSVIETPRKLPSKPFLTSEISRETTPSKATEPLTIAMDTRSLLQTAPCARSPPRSVQSIFKQPNTQLYQTHEAHKIPLREPQKLTTPVFLKSLQKTQPPTQSQMKPTPSRENTANLPLSNPLFEYAEKLKHAPPKAVNRKTLRFGNIKSKSMPESDYPRATSLAAADSSVLSVMDRARLWQQERRLEEISQSKSGFVDQDLIAHGDELVPVEERVRAFNTGQILEENEAVKKKFNAEFEEERNRRIQEQSFLTDLRPQTLINLKKKLQSQTIDPLSSQDAHGDTLTKLSVKEKSNLFARRSGGVRPVKADRMSMSRRRTQPITLDDIARVNQCILQGSGIPPDSPMESFKGDDLEIGSCLSSPSASVVSDFSEIVHVQNPSKHRGVRIF